MATDLNVKLGIAVTTIGAVLAIVSVGVYVRDWMLGIPASRNDEALHLIVLCLWIIVPPIWFACETYLVDPEQKSEKLRRSQEGFSRIWVGVSAMLGVLASAFKKP
jgi:hypothetical protein